MSRVLCFDLSGIPVRFTGLDPELADLFAERWSDYLVGEVAAPVVELAVTTEGASAPEGPLDMRSPLEETTSGGRTHLVFADGSLELPANLPARARLAPAPVHRRFWVLVNLFSAALGPRWIERGGLLLHAAAVVIDGRGFVLVAPEGGGKTTWADLARDAGALYLSDDVAVLDGSKGALEVLSTPIRGSKPRPAPPGRWPVAAVLLPRHGTEVALEPVRRLQLLARLEANVLFTADARREPALARLLNAIADGTPARLLTFAREPSFVERLRTWSDERS